MVPEPGIASIITAIRRSRNYRSQKEVAQRAGISEALLSQLVNGHATLTEDAFGKLVAAFPDFEQGLRRVLRSTTELDGINSQLQYTDALIRKGRIGEAYGTLERLTHDALPGYMLVEVNCRLAGFDFDQGNPEKGATRYYTALTTAQAMHDLSLVTTTVDSLATRLTALGLYNDATEALKECLGSAIYDTVLWRRLGVVRWYADDLVGAYGFLTTALDLGHPRVHILHARGQVLVELGDYQNAIAELTEAIDNARTPLSQSYARSSRARAYALAGDLDKALNEFVLAEKICPDNGWLHFFRAMSYDESGMKEQAMFGYDRALAALAPPLTIAKREFAARRSNDLRQGPQS